MADKRAYFKLDVGYLTNPKVAAVAAESPTAVLLHIEAIAYAAQHLTDGVVPLALIVRLAGATKGDAELLIRAGMLIDLGDGDVEVHDYLEHQRSAAEVKGSTDKARRAAHARWSSEDSTEHAEGNASSNASGMPNPMPREKERKRDNTTPRPATPDTFDPWWAVYPRKDAKGQARPAYKAALKKVGADELLALTVQWAQDHAGDDRQFLPLPASWLNGERWADERPGKRAVSASESGSFWDKRVGGAA